MREATASYISQKAADIANHDPRLPVYIDGQIFAPGVFEDTLSLQYEKKLVISAIKAARSKGLEHKSVKKVLGELDEIGFEAIYDVIENNTTALKSFVLDEVEGL